jgi:cysteine synthase A
MKIYNNVLETIGKTPLVRMGSMNKTSNEILLKLEYMNPCSSVKDRIAMNILKSAEDEGKINKNSVIIEATSGNTGIGLAFACAVKQLRCILVMPDSMSIERRKIIKAFGAELVLTPAVEGMKGSMSKAEEIHAQTPDSIIAGQFINPANPDIHRKTTAVEIWDDTNGGVDIFVSGVGTGGTITGTSEELKKRKKIHTVAVEPESSPVISGGSPGKHKIQGIGAGFIPDVLNTGIIDEVVTVTEDEAFNTARELARNEGIFCGISSGAATAAALKIAAKNENKQIVVILPSGGERYLSTILFDDIEA